MPLSKQPNFFRNLIWIFISSGGFVGFLPVCPGTFGALTGLVYFWFLKETSLLYQLVLTLSLSGLGVVASHLASKIVREKDPEFVVIDEIAGMWFALIGKNTWVEFVLAFVVFRFLDIKKPLFIGRLERFSGGWGIMLDDLWAGILTNGIVSLVFYVAKFYGLI
ncbi:phosphatidylglycerophosphatase A [Thermodesulfobacterium sp. TA1]|uniref:phosphatidylglycerophosphatase A family protein n=1 Tax=Thermodesulfobacterium sp. TA1 TaxID=2234087 RepID=UPI00123202D8|nr:phosphatidylglycerophosphatase A [Thermodesulfobacterium sp. TA1]QER41827.1 phosphatidylglycerophosphatase A [Thermodesulfobacterium sp. TA1]